MTKEFVRYLEMCVNFHHENDESFKITDSANAKENLMYLKVIHYINELYNDVEENHTVEQNAGENQIEGGVVSIGGSVDNFRCWKCGRTLPISERTDFAYMSNPPKYTCKECEGIKQEKQFRPFEEAAELILEYRKRFYMNNRCIEEPLIWVKKKVCSGDERSLITGYDINCVFIQDIWIDFTELYEKYVFLDDSACGVLEK